MGHGETHYNLEKPQECFSSDGGTQKNELLQMFPAHLSDEHLSEIVSGVSSSQTCVRKSIGEDLMIHENVNMNGNEDKEENNNEDGDEKKKKRKRKKSLMKHRSRSGSKSAENADTDTENSSKKKKRRHSKHKIKKSKSSALDGESKKKKKKSKVGESTQHESHDDEPPKHEESYNNLDEVTEFKIEKHDYSSTTGYPDNSTPGTPSYYTTDELTESRIDDQEPLGDIVVNDDDLNKQSEVKQDEFKTIEEFVNVKDIGSSPPVDQIKPSKRRSVDRDAEFYVLGDSSKSRKRSLEEQSKKTSMKGSSELTESSKLDEDYKREMEQGGTVTRHCHNCGRTTVCTPICCLNKKVGNCEDGSGMSRQSQPNESQTVDPKSDYSYRSESYGSSRTNRTLSSTPGVKRTVMFISTKPNCSQRS